MEAGEDAAVLMVKAAPSPPMLVFLPLLKQQCVESGLLDLPFGRATQRRMATRKMMTTGSTMRQMVSSLRPTSPLMVRTVVEEASTKSGPKNE